MKTILPATLLATLFALATPGAGDAGSARASDTGSAHTGVRDCTAGTVCAVRVAVGMPVRVRLPVPPVRAVADGGSGIEAVVRGETVVVRALRRDAAARFALVDIGGNVHRVLAHAVHPVRAGVPDLEVRIADGRVQIP